MYLVIPVALELTLNHEDVYLHTHNVQSIMFFWYRIPMGSQCNHGIFIGAWAMFGVWSLG